MILLFYFAGTENVITEQQTRSPFMILIGLECNCKSRYSYFDK